jgi:hypothetical protein
LTAAKIATNLIVAKHPQKIAVINAPSDFVRLSLLLTEKVATKTPKLISIPMYRRENRQITPTKMSFKFF